MAAILECQIKKNETSSHKKTFWHKFGSISTNGSWDIVIFVFILFLVTAPDLTAILDGQFAYIWSSSIQKNHNSFIQETFWHKVGSISNNGLEILSFSCLCYLRNGPWRPSWIVSLHNMKWFHSGTIVIESDQNIFMFSWDIGIWAKLDLYGYSRYI